MKGSGTLKLNVEGRTMKSGQYIQWQDLFVLVDDGSISLARYKPIGFAMQQQAKLFPQGIACFVILPSGAKPPPEDVKRYLKEQLTQLGPSLSCLSYIIEGTGFKAVAARAALISMKIFASRPYPIFVEMSIRDGLNKVIPHLTKGKTVTTDVKVIMKTISDARNSWTTLPPEPSPGRAGDMLAK